MKYGPKLSLFIMTVLRILVSEGDEGTDTIDTSAKFRSLGV